MRKLGALGLLLAFAIVPIGFSCSGGGGGNGIVTPPPPPPPPPPPGGGNTCPAGTVCMRSAVFDPTELSATKGSSVTFSNTSTVPHNIVFDAPRDPGVADVGQINAGATSTRTFNTAGTWNFHCTIHGGMDGKIVVP